MLSHPFMLNMIHLTVFIACKHTLCNDESSHVTMVQYMGHRDAFRK